MGVVDCRGWGLWGMEVVGRAVVRHGGCRGWGLWRMGVVGGGVCDLETQARAWGLTI